MVNYAKFFCIDYLNITPTKAITLQLLVLILESRVTNGSTWKIASTPSSALNIFKITEIFMNPTAKIGKKFFKEELI